MANQPNTKVKGQERQQTIDRLRQIAADCNTRYPGEAVAFCPGNDPATKEAMASVIEAYIDKLIASASHECLIDFDSVRQVKQKFRDSITESNAARYLKL